MSLFLSVKDVVEELGCDEVVFFFPDLCLLG